MVPWLGFLEGVDKASMMQVPSEVEQGLGGDSFYNSYDKEPSGIMLRQVLRPS